MNDLATTIEKAFDYRGDVTVDLVDGSQVVGFVFNRHPNGTRLNPEPRVEIMIQGSRDKVVLRYTDIQNVRLTGEDPAAGKSWEEYQAKRAAKKATEAGK